MRVIEVGGNGGREGVEARRNYIPLACLASLALNTVSHIKWTSDLYRLYLHGHFNTCMEGA